MNKNLVVIALASLLIMGGSYVSAFDSEAEINATINGQDSLYTAYFGQPINEIRANFAGAKGWTEAISPKNRKVSFARKNTEDEFLRTGIFGQKFYLTFISNQGDTYSVTNFPNGDFVVKAYESNFYMGDRVKALSLFKRFYDSFTGKYGAITLAAPVDTLRQGPNGTKWNSGYWKCDRFTCQLIITEHSENYYNVRVIYQQITAPSNF